MTALELISRTEMDPANGTVRRAISTVVPEFRNNRLIDLRWLCGMIDEPDEWNQKALIQMQIILILCVHHNNLCEAKSVHIIGFERLHKILMGNAESAMIDALSLLRQIIEDGKKKLSEVNKCS